MPNLREVDLALVFSRGTSIAMWKQYGHYDREMKQISNLAASLKSITLFTYDNQDTNAIDDNDRLPDNIQVIPMHRTSRSNLATSILFPLMNYKKFKQINVWKCQQADGAWTALIFSKLTHSMFYFRQGFRWSEFLRERRKWVKYAIVLFCEYFLVRSSDICVVTSETDMTDMNSLYRHQKVQLLPNWAFDDEIRIHGKKPIDLQHIKCCFIGRLTKEKNVDYIIDFVQNLKNFSLDLYGLIFDDIESTTQFDKKKICFKGQVQNNLLLKRLQDYDFIILASKMEGHPKALIEAMAHGVVPICTEAPGIKQIIKNRFNGLIISGNDVDYDKNMLYNYLEFLDINELSKKAKETVRNLSLQKITQRELHYLESALFDSK